MYSLASHLGPATQLRLVRQSSGFPAYRQLLFLFEVLFGAKLKARKSQRAYKSSYPLVRHFKVLSFNIYNYHAQRHLLDNFTG